MGSFGENGFGIKYMIALTVLFLVVVCLGLLRLWVLRRRTQRENQDIKAVAVASAERATDDVRYLTAKRMEEGDYKNGTTIEVTEVQSPPVASVSPHSFLPSVFNYNTPRSLTTRTSHAPSTSLAIMTAAATAAAPTGSAISTPLTSLPPTPGSPPKALSPPLSVFSQRRGTGPSADSPAPFLPPHELGTSSPSLEKARLVVIPQRIRNIEVDFISPPQKAETKSSLFSRRQEKNSKDSISSVPAHVATPASARSSGCISSASTATELPDIPLVSPFRFSKPFAGVTLNFDDSAIGKRSSIRKSSSGSSKIIIVEKDILPNAPAPTDTSRKSYVRAGVGHNYKCMTPIIEQVSTKSLELSRAEVTIPEDTVTWVVGQQQQQQQQDVVKDKKPSITVETVEIEATPATTPDASPEEATSDKLSWDQVEAKQLRDSNATLVDNPQPLSNLTHQILTSVYPHFPVDSSPSYPTYERRASESGQRISDIYDCYAHPVPTPTTPSMHQALEGFRASMIGTAVSTNIWVPGPWVNFEGYELGSGNFPWQPAFLMSSKPFAESPIAAVPSPCVEDFKCLSPKSLIFDSEKCMCSPMPSPMPSSMPVV